jgi:hypothetical protein
MPLSGSEARSMIADRVPPSVMKYIPDRTAWCT